ncbi:lipoprotein-releasing ABC transporter permease subunit [Nitrospina watsonii]|uniref:Lipoprotein releasing system transmembrane protein LolE n=1 Tax=Nitrospina watsonii TaxID=1323948 RepID=A0ABM9HCH7_9BACT|nr:lipoprotein-releasing ABC transporter permease subunit [Nitrospina watsonii]CAI2717802.1 Lipoprotein releasing system transmembrane protein LolE [Nitrospina watsonii]
MGYELRVSWRHLCSRKSHKFISLITFISVGGVALGVMALIVVIAVMSGFGKNLRDKILGTNSHIVVTSFERNGIVDYEKVVTTVKEVEEVRAAAPFILKQVMLTYGQRTSGVVIRGVDPKREASISDLEKNMIQGKLEDLTGAPSGASSIHRKGIILGVELSRSLGVSVGDVIGMLAPSVRMTPLGVIPNIKMVQVVGLFESGMYEYDANLAFVSIEAAQKLFNMKETVTGIEIKVEDIDLAWKTAESIQKKLEFPYVTRDWMQMNKNLFSALKLEKITMFIILILIILVAAFNIISTLFMVVMEKAKDIAILKSMGATSSSIMKIFSMQGLIIGLVGTGLGVVAGFTIVPNLNEIVGFIETVFNIQAFPSDVYYLDRLPSEIQYFDSFLIIVFSILICFAASLYPAWRAARLDPVDGLRYE